MWSSSTTDISSTREVTNSLPSLKHSIQSLIHLWLHWLSRERSFPVKMGKGWYIPILALRNITYLLLTLSLYTLKWLIVWKQLPVIYNRQFWMKKILRIPFDFDTGACDVILWLPSVCFSISPTHCAMQFVGIVSVPIEARVSRVQRPVFVQTIPWEPTVFRRPDAPLPSPPTLRHNLALSAR